MQKYTKKGTNMNRKELSQNHWKYYLMLEKRFVESIEFVELHEDNFDAFSNGYALLIQAIGAELDTVFKEFCGFNTTDRKTVADYAQYILTNTPDIKNQKISVQEYDIEIQPFMNWDITQPAQSLQWWGAFTDVKHNRYEQLKQAKQENADFYQVYENDGETGSDVSLPSDDVSRDYEILPEDTTSIPVDISAYIQEK